MSSNFLLLEPGDKTSLSNFYICIFPYFYIFLNDLKLTGKLQIQNSVFFCCARVIHHHGACKHFQLFSSEQQCSPARVSYSPETRSAARMCCFCLSARAMVRTTPLIEKGSSSQSHGWVSVISFCLQQCLAPPSAFLTLVLWKMRVQAFFRLAFHLGLSAVSSWLHSHYTSAAGITEVTCSYFFLTGSTPLWFSH